VRWKGLFKLRRKKHVDTPANNNNSSSSEKDVQKLLEELDTQLGDIIVDIIHRATERPSIWWQWLMLILVGVGAGIGIGILISNMMLPRQIVVPPQNITIHF
jgi:hypothetical protein